MIFRACNNFLDGGKKLGRRDRVINICESKFSINEFTIDKEYDSKLRNIIDAFRQDTKINKM
jgi:hypothetical protein